MTSVRAPFLVTTTRRALRRLLTVLVDHRTQGKEVECYGRSLDPLVFELPGPEWQGSLSGHWMLRIVDVEQALTQRGYPHQARGTVHFAVRDDLLRANRDRFVLEVEGGRGRVRRGGRGQVKIDVRGLAALYTGCLTPLELASLTPHLAASPAQCRALTPLFAGPAPYMIAAF